MSTPVETVIRTHLQANDVVQETIEWAEIVSRHESAGSSRPPTWRRGVWVAVAAAVVTLLLVGGVAWLRSFNETVPPVDQPTVTTLPTETSEDPIVSWAEAGPEPRFDTSPLGLEVVFEARRPCLIPGVEETCGPSVQDDYGLMSAGGDQYSTTITVRVPPETSVVGIIAHTRSASWRFWQRPIGGWGVFEVPGWPDGTPGPRVIAFDADGIQIGQWCSGSPDPSFPRLRPDRQDCTS